MKISQIWLKIPIQAHKNHVLGVFLPPNIIFYYRDPQKGSPYAETRVLSHKWSWSVFWCDLEVRTRIQKGEKHVTENALPRRPPFCRLPSTKFWTWSRVPDIFLGFKFHYDRLKNVGSVTGGRNFGLPFDLAYRLYNSLLLSHKP